MAYVELKDGSIVAGGAVDMNLKSGLTLRRPTILMLLAALGIYRNLSER